MIRRFRRIGMSLIASGLIAAGLNYLHPPLAISDATASVARVTADGANDAEDAEDTPSAEDRRIANEIRRQLQEDENLSILAKRVLIFVDEGQVTLRGSVDNASEKQQVANIAKRVEEELERRVAERTSELDAALEQLAAMGGLQTVYLWQTQVSEEGVDDLRARRPDLTVEFGNPFFGT